jgi:His-Xaa-Ser system radical SAM maturase HxsC
LHARLGEPRDSEPVVVRLTRNPAEPNREKLALLFPDTDELPTGFAAYFVRERDCIAWQSDGRLIYALPDALSYLDDGDVIRINPRQAEAWVMYRRSSRSNSLLLTERCNSWCIMCSQPPKAREDGSLVRAWLDAIPLLSAETRELGFTGGEPTLLGDLFLNLVIACRDHLPSTGLHILSNGRLFNYLSFAQQFSAIGHPNLMLGIPIYSDIAWQHDFIVQAPKSFDQTIRGLLNLARCGVRVEIRVVIHRCSVKRLPNLAKFIARNLPFVEHVALMGLEPIGFAKSNLGALWIDPVDYQEELEAAVRTLDLARMNASIYNHQLCVLPTELWPFARQSISDWKNVYLPLCDACSVQERCGGFFHSSITTHSRSIHPLAAEPVSDSP